MTQYNRPYRRRRLSLFQIILILAAVGFAAWYVMSSFAPEKATSGRVEAGLLGAQYTGNALIIRDEKPYVAEGITRIDYKAEEGEVCPRGTEICNVYSSGFSTKDMTVLQDHRDQIRDYERKLLANEKTNLPRMQRLEDDVLARAREVRDIISGSRGSLTNEVSLLKAAIEARQRYIRNEYATDQRLSRLLEDENNQVKTINAQKRQYVSTKDHTIVSFYSDGYEYGLTLENYSTFSPSQVRSMMNGTRPDQGSGKNKITIYRTVEADKGYEVLFLVDDTGWNPINGQTYELRLEEFVVVTATLESSTRAGGELLLRLRVQDDVKPVLYMRVCRGTLGDFMSTMKVPARAIHEQDGMSGVVVRDMGREVFIPVQVIYKTGDSAYVTPVTQGLLLPGMEVLLF